MVRSVKPVCPHCGQRIRTAADPAPRSEHQDVGTPWEFIRAVEARFGPISLDLASTPSLAKAEAFITPEEDSLKQPWAELLAGDYGPGWGWLNPQFSRVGKLWAPKVRAEALLGASILMLTPAATDSCWFRDYVNGIATVVHPLNPRLVFEGEKDSYPKPLMLSVFAGVPPDGITRFEPWEWKRST